MTNKDYFQHKAEGYEKVSQRVENVDKIANAIIRHIELKPRMQLMDFGSGTGLLLERIAPSVRSISAVDVSSSMNAQLEKKRALLECDLEIIELDLSIKPLERQFDGIISSMTMHHVKNTGAMLTRFHSLLKPEGFIAVADLDAEDGSFHSEDTGVFHFGFNREALIEATKESGFSRVTMTTANTIHKPQGDFSVFLLTAYR